MEIKNVTGYETGHYNPETCCNGGGYWQFAGTAEVGDWNISVDDTSCGGYGDRVFFEVRRGDITSWVWYNTMQSDCSYDPDDDWGNSSNNWDIIDPDCILTPDVLWQVHTAIDNIAWNDRSNRLEKQERFIIA